DTKNPNWSPSGTVIAFDSNAAGVDGATGLLAGTAPKRNIFVSYQSGPNTAGPQGKNTQPFVQMTNFPGADSIEPNFSQKVGGNTPNNTGNKRLLAFASQRADTDGDGKADAAVNTYNLYWIVADDGKSAAPNTSNSTSESNSNAAHPILTQDTDPNVP